MRGVPVCSQNPFVECCPHPWWPYHPKKIDPDGSMAGGKVWNIVVSILESNNALPSRVLSHSVCSCFSDISLHWCPSPSLILLTQLQVTFLPNSCINTHVCFTVAWPSYEYLLPQFQVTFLCDSCINTHVCFTVAWPLYEYPLPLPPSLSLFPATGSDFVLKRAVASPDTKILLWSAYRLQHGHWWSACKVPIVPYWKPFYTCTYKNDQPTVTLVVVSCCTGALLQWTCSWLQLHRCVIYVKSYCCTPPKEGPPPSES